MKNYLAKLFISGLLVFVAAMFCVATASAQNEQYEAPVKWETYRSADLKMSVSLPKLPVLTRESVRCDQLEIAKFAAYANDVIFGVNHVSKLGENIDEACKIKRPFDQFSFQTRIDELAGKEGAKKPVSVKIGNHSFKFIGTALVNYWLLPDFEGKRWVELWIVNGDENSGTVITFLSSFTFSDDLDGKEIGEGSDSTKGDTKIGSSGSDMEAKSSESEGVTHGVKIITTPKPSYSDMARLKNIEGKVLLKITFLASGGIGAVSVVSGLEYGLTEQAVEVAKKIIFIPFRRNGAKISITKTVQYSFSIY